MSRAVAHADVVIGVLDASRRPRVFFGWIVVAVAFAVALFGYGIGFYGAGIYLVALNREHGWPIAFISSGITAYYVLGACIVAFLGDLVERIGLRRVVLSAIAALAAGLMSLAFATRPWHVYAAFAVMAPGWAGMGGAAINAIVAPWFDKKRGLAVSMALNGASCGGVLMAPLWTVLIGRLGFAPAALLMSGAMLVLLVPPVAVCLGRGPEEMGLGPDGEAAPRLDCPRVSPGAASVPGRRQLMRGGRFWTISIPFALGLLAQVGFLTHQVAYLGPSLGPAGAALAVSLTSIAAIAGRLIAGLVIDRIDRRLASAGNFTIQIAAIIGMIAWPSIPVLYVASVVFGLGVGNTVSFSSLIVHAEYPPALFNRIVSLIVAINQFTFAFGPGILGWVRDATGSYAAALLLCATWEGAAVIVLLLGVDRRRR